MTVYRTYRRDKRSKFNLAISYIMMASGALLLAYAFGLI